MDLKTMQELVKQSATSRAEFQNHYDEALRYYSARNDIVNRNNGRSQLNPDGKSDPLRRADNRVSSNFYQLMVDQEAGYLATTAPTIDVGKDRDNKLIAQVLGDDFGLTLSNTVVESSNAGRA